MTMTYLQAAVEEEAHLESASDFCSLVDPSRILKTGVIPFAKTCIEKRRQAKS